MDSTFSDEDKTSEIPSKSIWEKFKSRYLTFEGRLTRRDVVYRHLQIILMLFPIGFIAFFMVMAPKNYAMVVLIPSYLVVLVILFISTISLAVRRLHDMDRTGGWIWIYIAYNFIILAASCARIGEPQIGNPLALLGPIQLMMIPCQFFHLWVLFSPGTRGENSYGPDPRGRLASKRTLWQDFIEDFFSVTGRMGPGRYTLTFFSTILASSGFSQVVGFVGAYYLLGSPVSLTYALTLLTTSISAVIIMTVSALMLLLAFISQLTISIRRFHDMGCSGAWSVILFLPWLLLFVTDSLGVLALAAFFVFAFIAFSTGTNGENQYGPDPEPSPIRRSGNI